VQPGPVERTALFSPREARQAFPIRTLNPVTPMNHDSLERLLEELRQRPAPRLPSHFDQDVWQRIRALRRAKPEPWWDTLGRAFWQPRGVAAAVAVTLTIAVGFGRSAPRANGPKAALGLEAFSPEGPWLPSTLLSRAR